MAIICKDLIIVMYVWMHLCKHERRKCKIIETTFLKYKLMWSRHQVRMDDRKLYKHFFFMENNE